MGSKEKGLTFEILSTKIADTLNEKKYVIYTLQINFNSENDDASPSVIERRYTHFFDLYTSLKKEHPNLMNNIVFPKKVILGNFDNDLISTRSTGFETLLKHISTESRLRNSNSLLSFLQDVEVNQANELYKEEKYVEAYNILENNFKLLNKIYTDRTPSVILALIRIVACMENVPNFPDVLKWADLAIHRYEGVSDSDLLELYAPLLQTCVKLWTQNGRKVDEIENKLKTLQRQGMKMNESTSLMEFVNAAEQKIFYVPSISK